MAEDRLNGTIVVFGGLSQAGDSLGDTWTWDGTHWTEATGPGPIPDNGAAMVWDASRQEVLLVNNVPDGGVGGILMRTWSWDGGARTWTQEQPSTVPTARHQPNLAYDAQTNTVVMFGGWSTATSLVLDETWTWDGDTWTLQNPPVRPAARATAAMAYDPVSKKVVLTGGRFVPQETWSWDGIEKTWTAESPSVQPPVLHASALTYHEPSEKLVLFGGQNTGVQSNTNDTWTYDGRTRNWTLEEPIVRPSARRAHTMAYHAPTQRLITTTGSGPGAPGIQEVWGWNGSNWKPAVVGPAVSIGNAYAYEGDNGASAAAIFPVTLSKPASTTVRMNYQTVSGYASEGSDFSAASGTVTIPAGQTRANIRVTLIGDTFWELNRPDNVLQNGEFFVVFLNDVRGAHAFDTAGFGVVVDDDPSSGPADPSTRFAIGGGAVHEGNVGGRVAIVTVTLSVPRQAPTSVAYATAPGSAAANSDYTPVSGILFFAPGTSSMSVKIPVVADRTVEGDETFTLELSSSNGAPITDASGVVTIFDDH